MWRVELTVEHNPCTFKELCLICKDTVQHQSKKILLNDGIDAADLENIVSIGNSTEFCSPGINLLVFSGLHWVAQPPALRQDLPPEPCHPALGGPHRSENLAAEEQ